MGEGFLRLSFRRGLTTTVVITLVAFFALLPALAAQKTPKACAHLLTQGISPEWLEAMRQRTLTISPEIKAIQEQIQRNGFRATQFNATLEPITKNPFTLELPTGELSDQDISGNCWLFSFCHAIRTPLILKNKVPANFMVSVNYLLFHNLLQNVHQYLSAVETKLAEPGVARALAKFSSKDASSFTATVREARHAFRAETVSGGEAFHFLSLAEQYGLVPQVAMPHTFSTKDEDNLYEDLGRVLSEFADKALQANKRGEKSLTKNLPKYKAQTMQKAWDLLTAHLGVPPSKFTFENKEYTPQDFMRTFLEFNPAQFAVVTSQKHLKKNSLIELNEKNMFGNRIRFLNISRKHLEELVLKALRAGYPVQFSADVYPDLIRDQGIMHKQAFNRSGLADAAPRTSSQSKNSFKDLVERTGLLHSMLITGVELDAEGKNVVRFKVENSWGHDYPAVYHLFHDWFLAHVFEISIPRHLLSPYEIRVLEGLPTYKIDNADLI